MSNTADLSLEIHTLANEVEVLRATLRNVRLELTGIGVESSKEFHRLGIDSAVSMINSVLKVSA